MKKRLRKHCMATLEPESLTRLLIYVGELKDHGGPQAFVDLYFLNGDPWLLTRMRRQMKYPTSKMAGQGTSAESFGKRHVLELP